MTSSNTANPRSVRRPRPRGRRRWYTLALVVLVVLSAAAVTIRASSRPRPGAAVLAPTDPSVPVHAIKIPDNR